MEQLTKGQYFDMGPVQITKDELTIKRLQSLSLAQYAAKHSLGFDMLTISDSIQEVIVRGNTGHKCFNWYQMLSGRYFKCNMIVAATNETVYFQVHAGEYKGKLINPHDVDIVGQK